MPSLDSTLVWSKMKRQIGCRSQSAGVITPCMLQMNMMFANHSKEDVIYPLIVKEIALAQERDLVLKKLTKMEKYSTHLVEDTEVQCKDGKMVIPTVLQCRAVSWYQNNLQHPLQSKDKSHPIWCD